MIHDKAKVVAHLRGLGDGSVEPRNRRYGICWELYGEFGADDDEDWVSVVGGLSLDWKGFSGDSTFPVKARKRKGEYNDDAWHRIDDKWTGKYGASRRRLCAHLADKIEAMEGELEV